MNEQLITRRPQGRRYHKGTYIIDRATKRLGVFVDYCPHCTYKIIVDHDELFKIAKFAHKDMKTRDFRLLRFLLRIRSL